MYRYRWLNRFYKVYLSEHNGQGALCLCYIMHPSHCARSYRALYKHLGWSLYLCFQEFFLITFPMLPSSPSPPLPNPFANTPTPQNSLHHPQPSLPCPHSSPPPTHVENFFSVQSSSLVQTLTLNITL